MSSPKLHRDIEACTVELELMVSVVHKRPIYNFNSVTFLCFWCLLNCFHFCLLVGVGLLCQPCNEVRHHELALVFLQSQSGFVQTCEYLLQRCQVILFCFFLWQECHQYRPLPRESPAVHSPSPFENSRCRWHSECQMINAFVSVQHILLAIFKSCW